MPKVHKVTLYVFDANDEYHEKEDVINDLTRYIDGDFCVDTNKSSEYFEFEDELKINRSDATTKDYEEYFN